MAYGNPKYKFTKEQIAGQGGGGFSVGSGFSDPNAWSSAVNRDVEMMGGRRQSIVTKGGGDVEMLKKVLDEMSKSTTAEGMQTLIQSIFKTGFEKQMPQLLSAANTAGIRPQDATTQTLLQNDLVSRLVGEGVKALGTQQAATAQAASSYGQLTEKPVVTTLEEQGKASGTTNRLSLFGQGLGLWS